jgi:hypothetical protein
VRTLEQLTEREPPATRQPDFRTAGGVIRRQETQEMQPPVRRDTPVQAAPQRASQPAEEAPREGAGPAEDEIVVEEREPAQPRRGVRGLFWRDDH